MKDTARRPHDADLDLPMVKVAIERYERQEKRDLWRVRGVALAGLAAAGVMVLVNAPAIVVAPVVYAAGVVGSLLFGLGWVKRRDRRAGKETE